MSARKLIFDRLKQRRELRYTSAGLYELRYTAEVRASASGRTLRLEGHAAVFNTPTKIANGKTSFRERIMPGAFRKVLDANADVPFLLNHDSSKIFGRTTAGTLRLDEDSRGLKYVVDLPNTEEGRSLHCAVQRGDISGSSFGFSLGPDDDSWDEDEDEDRSRIARRTIRNVSILRDCSAVTYPAYSGTDAQARSTVEVPYEIRSSVEAHNNAGVIVTPEIALQITINAIERQAREREAIARRKSTMNNLLS